MVLIKKILVATDFSEPSGAALAYGRDLARATRAQLLLIHVVGDVVLPHVPGTDLQSDIEAAAIRDLTALITDEDRRDRNAVAMIERGGDPAEAVTRYAGSHAIDLIVTGTHGRGVVKHLLMGSVAERIVRTAPCPVLTVRAHERDFIVPDAMTLAAAV